MNLHPQSRILHGLALPILLLSMAALPAALQAQPCSGQMPARHVPGPNPEHDPAAPGVDLWLPGIFRPGLTGLANRQLPAERDSTTWNSIGDFPNCAYGHEIYESLEIAGDYLYVAYNVGFSIWDISGSNAENPERVIVRDGLGCQLIPPGNHCNVPCGPFLSFPHGGEVDFLIEDIDVFEAGGSTVYIALSGENSVGMTLWRFNTATESLAQLYQDTTRVSRQVRLVEVGSTIYAFSTYSDGLAVYDVTRAEAIDPCLQEDSSDCAGVYVGNLGTATKSLYLDVMQRPTGEILVATSDGRVPGGVPLGLQLWQVNNPASPGTAIKLFDGLDALTYGIAMFNYEGNDYLSTLEFENGPNANVIKIFDIDGCGGGPCSLGAPVFDDISVPARISPQFMTFSTSNGTPFLYHGINRGLGGPHVEQLLNLTTLGRPGQNITEMTDGGPTYADACEEPPLNLDYWAWYLSGNEYGINNLAPRIGKFHPDSNFFYRAAGSVLDVHVWEAGINPLEPAITTTLTNPDPQALYWMSDELTFEGTGSNGCNPAGLWTWTPTTPPDVDAVTVSQTSNQVTYRFECNSTSGRCADSVVSVSGANSDVTCAGADEVAAAITVKDPSIEITSITPDGGTVTQCTIVTFEAELVGRGPVDFAWNVNGVEEEAGTVPEEDLSTSMATFDWDTTMVTFDEIFSDGFESGDTRAWSETVPRQRGTLPVTIELALDSGNTADSVTVDLSSVTGDPEFGTPPITSSTTDNSTFDFQANTVLGTVSEWSWELEDDDGASMCTFGVDTDVPCTIKTGQAISHTWVLQNGDRRVDVTISNCQTAITAEASTTVTVESTEELVITSFELDRAQSNGACEINFDCISDLICLCHTGETVFFEATSTGSADFYDFDWDGNGTFEDINNPATETEFTHLYPTTLGEIVPEVRARRGAAAPAQRDLRETLDIQP